MSDEWQDSESAVIEYERERERLNKAITPNIPPTTTRSSLGCGGFLVRLVINLFLFTAIIEIISILTKL